MFYVDFIQLNSLLKNTIGESGAMPDKSHFSRFIGFSALISAFILYGSCYTEEHFPAVLGQLGLVSTTSVECSRPILCLFY